MVYIEIKDKLAHNHTSMTKNLDDSYLHIQHLCRTACPFTSAFIRSTPWSSGYFIVDITPDCAEVTNGVAPAKEKHKSAIYITHTVRCQRVTHMRAYNFQKHKKATIRVICMNLHLQPNFDHTLVPQPIICRHTTGPGMLLDHNFLCQVLNHHFLHIIDAPTLH